MKVILINDVKSLGKKGDIVNVSDGYAHNFLLKKNLGLPATAKNLNDLKLKREHDQRLERQLRDDAKKLADELSGKSVVISIKTGENGKAFGSVSTKEISAEVLSQLGIDIDKKKMVLDSPIKSEGTYEVPVKLHPEVTAKITIVVKGKDKGA